MVNNDGQISEEFQEQFKLKEKDLKEYHEQQTFYDNFCNKLIFCDPLDRSFIREIDDGVMEEQATKVAEVVKMVTKMPTFKGNTLRVILDKEKHK